MLACPDPRRYSVELGLDSQRVAASPELHLLVEALKHGRRSTRVPLEAQLVLRAYALGRPVVVVHQARRGAMAERAERELAANVTR